MTRHDTLREESVAYGLHINGRDHAVQAGWLGESLLYVLRERLGLPGAKNACEQGECGSCSVLVDGALVCACLELAEAAAGCEITTVEGLAPAGGEPGDSIQCVVRPAVQRERAPDRFKAVDATNAIRGHRPVPPPACRYASLILVLQGMERRRLLALTGR